MVRRDRVRDRTDRGDRDVRYCFLSHLLSGRLLLFPKRMAFWFLSLSSSFKSRTCDDEVNKDGKEKGEKTRARSSCNPSLSNHKTGTR